MNIRLSNASNKPAKIRNLALVGWRAINMMRAHVVLAVTYSARVNGVPTQIMENLRTRSATSTRAFGGSASMDLL